MSDLEIEEQLGTQSSLPLSGLKLQLEQNTLPEKGCLVQILQACLPACFHTMAAASTGLSLYHIRDQMVRQVFELTVWRPYHREVHLLAANEEAYRSALAERTATASAQTTH